MEDDFHFCENERRTYKKMQPKAIKNKNSSFLKEENLTVLKMIDESESVN